MATKPQVMKKLASMGIEWDPDHPTNGIQVDKDSRDAIIDAPAGKYFKYNNLHVVSTGGWGMKDFWDNTHDILEEGLGDCSDGQCDSEDHNTHPALGPQFG